MFFHYLPPSPPEEYLKRQWMKKAVLAVLKSGGTPSLRLLSDLYDNLNNWSE